MKKLLILFCLAPLLMAHTCEDDDHRHHHNPCTMEARAGLNVMVTLDGEQLTSAAGISVTARDGNYIEDLQTYGPPYVFSGAYERSGRYVITVTKDGYQDYVSPPVRVTQDECHVIPQQLSVDLVPNP